MGAPIAQLPNMRRSYMELGMHLPTITITVDIRQMTAQVRQTQVPNV